MSQLVEGILKMMQGKIINRDINSNHANELLQGVKKATRPTRIASKQTNLFENRHFTPQEYNSLKGRRFVWLIARLATGLANSRQLVGPVFINTN